MTFKELIDHPKVTVESDGIIFSNIKFEIRYWSDYLNSFLIGKMDHAISQNYNMKYDRFYILHNIEHNIRVVFNPNKQIDFNLTCDNFWIDNPDIFCKLVRELKIDDFLNDI